ncbi:hypothetical protein Tco_1539265 [Tanacetum coccineum]
MFTRSLVIQKRVKDLQLGVESYQKKINITKPDTTRPDLRKRHPYTPYKDPQGFIYVDDYKRNKLMRSDELYKFSDGTLTRLLSLFEDITMNIDIEYLPKRRWSNLEKKRAHFMIKKRAHFMIKDINKLLKERRMMRSLEKFVGGQSSRIRRFCVSVLRLTNEDLLGFLPRRGLYPFQKLDCFLSQDLDCVLSQDWMRFVPRFVMDLSQGLDCDIPNVPGSDLHGLLCLTRMTLHFMVSMIRLYCRGKENGVKSEVKLSEYGPFQDGVYILWKLLQEKGENEGTDGYGGALNRVGNPNPGQARQVKCYNYNGGPRTRVDEDVDEPPVQDLVLNVDNVFQADDCDAFDSDVDEAPIAQTMFMANLSFADPVYDEAGSSYDSNILSECVMCESHAQSLSKTTQNVVVDNSLTAELETYKEQVELYERQARKHDEIEWKNLLIENDNLIVDCLFKDVFHVAMNSKLNVSSFTEMHDAHTSLKARCLDLEVELSNLRNKIQKDNHDELIKWFSNLEITQLTKKINVLQEQNEFFGAENGKIKQHYKELYDSIKITRAKHLEQTTALLTENESLKNNREVHLVCLKHLKESVETHCEIGEEAKAERPLDRSLASACRYTKHSQELLEYVIDTCPKALNTRDNKHASTYLPKEKQVTFEE